MKVNEANKLIILSIMIILLSPLYFLALLILEIIDSVWFQIKKNEK